MSTPEKKDDPTAVSRKKDHIELAFASQVVAGELDNRFYYEPLLSAHPIPGQRIEQPFLGKTLLAPLWVSSMTGGTEKAGRINRNLAKACAEFGMGLGLGSCRQLLFSQEHLADFDVRDIMGEDRPLFANLGIAQLESLLHEKATDKISELVHRLRADGLIIHVNPLQEALQPEGDHFHKPPIETIQALTEVLDMQLIVKEVGQGMGPESLRALLQLPLAAIEFAAGGGTNFAKLELQRADSLQQEVFGKLAQVGHTAAEMMAYVIQLKAALGDACQVQQLILSGGIKHFLDGYYLLEKSPMPAVFGQASGFLKYAEGDYAHLQAFVQAQVKGLALAKAYLKVK
jgi:isopentenyl-diphosphate delta-isomerase